MIDPETDPVRYWAAIITGYLGSVLLGIVFIPQVVRVYRQRDASVISGSFLALNYLITIDMTAYGALIQQWPIIVANGMIVICVTLLVIAKFVFAKKSGEPPTEIVIEDKVEES